MTQKITKTSIRILGDQKYEDVQIISRTPLAFKIQRYDLFALTTVETNAKHVIRSRTVLDCGHEIENYYIDGEENGACKECDEIATREFRKS